MKSPEERLLEKRFINKETGCWEWQGYCDPKGYGVLKVGGKSTFVHRLSASVWMGFMLDSKKLVCHSCDNTKCFNPDHLFTGTAKDNAKDAMKKGRMKPLYPMFGVDNPSAILNEERVKSIRKEYKTTNITIKDLARRHGVSDTTIGDIINNRTWTHIRDGCSQISDEGEKDAD